MSDTDWSDDVLPPDDDDEGQITRAADGAFVYVGVFSMRVYEPPSLVNRMIDDAEHEDVDWLYLHSSRVSNPEAVAAGEAPSYVIEPLRIRVSSIVCMG